MPGMNSLPNLGQQKPAQQLTSEQLTQMSSSVLNLLPAAAGEGQKGGERRVDCDVLNNPGYNFVGRILGPRGSTLKGLEAQYNCRIYIRGKGSEKPEEEGRKRGRPGYEHLEENLHCLIDGGAAGDVEGCAAALTALVTPVPEGQEDPLKAQQLSSLSQLRSTETGGPMRGKDMSGGLPAYMTGGLKGNPY